MCVCEVGGQFLRRGGQYLLADYVRGGQFPLADYVPGDKICGGTESAPTPARVHVVNRTMPAVQLHERKTSCTIFALSLAILYSIACHAHRAVAATPAGQAMAGVTGIRVPPPPPPPPPPILGPGGPICLGNWVPPPDPVA